MKPNGSSPENEPDPFAQAAKEIAKILSASGVISCEMTLTMNDMAGATLTSTLTIESAAMDEDRAPDQTGLDGVFVLFATDDETTQQP